MNISFLEQKVDFVFDANYKLYRIIFERKQENAKWAVQLIDIAANETIYHSMMDPSISPDIDFAGEILRTFVARGQA